jgi:hypothetical protein
VGDNGALLRYKPLSVSVGEGSVVSGQQSAIRVYPNPFRESTTVKFQIPNSKFHTHSKFRIQNSKLVIYNAVGNEVRILTDSSLPAGEHQFNFDAQGLPAGIYYCLLFVDGKKAGATKLVALD